MSHEFTQLRPMGIGEILDHSIKLYRDNFSRFFGILLVSSAMVFVAQQPFILLNKAIQRNDEFNPLIFVAFAMKRPAP